MIWIDNSTTIIEIPKHSSVEGLRYDLQLVNVITKKEYTFPADVSVSDSALLYKFHVDSVDLDDEGEYEYYLYTYVVVEGEEIKTLIESGLLVYGDYVRENAPSFEPEANTIVQFNG